MQAVRFVLVVSVALGAGIAFAACGGKVDIEADDAAVDTAPTTTTTASTTSPTTTTTTTTTTTVPPPSCPSYRPVRGVPCAVGLSCSFPCGSGYDYAIRATCPAGKWVLENVSPCGG